MEKCWLRHRQYVHDLNSMHVPHHLLTCHYHCHLYPLCFLPYTKNEKLYELMLETGFSWVKHKHEQFPADLFWLSVVSLPPEKKNNKKTKHKPTEYCSFHSNRNSDGEGVGVWRRVEGRETMTGSVKAVTVVREEMSVWCKWRGFTYTAHTGTLVHTLIHASPLLLSSQVKAQWRWLAWLSPLIIIPPPPFIRHPLQLDKPTTNQLLSPLQRGDLKIASSHL